MGVGDSSDSAIPDRLVQRFFQALQALAPSSVLDVGCGRGPILRRCRAAGIEAHGIEPDSGKVADMAADGLSVSVARAEELPFADGSFEWVAMRHVAHHLEDVRPALAEAFRVCRRGLLLAEPWLDLGVASQRVARRFDQWLETQNTRLGHVHRTPLSTAEFLAALEPDVAATVDARFERFLILRERPAGWLRTEAEPLLTDLDHDHPARAELAAIEAAARDEGLSYNGTSILVLDSGSIR